MRPRFRERIRQRFSQPAKPSAAGTIDYRAMLEATLDLICLVDIRESVPHFVYCTPSVKELLGWTQEEFATLSLEEFYPPESLAVIAADIERLSKGEGGRDAEIQAIHRDGSRIWLNFRVRIIEMRGPGEMTVVVAGRDVTNRRNLEEQLARFALLDGLTGIDNRRAFDIAFEREWSASARSGSPLSLIMIDVDNFKLFNDRYGHQVGDDCLCATAHALRTGARRPTDMVARYGGEEFAILLPSTTSAGAEIVANQVREAVQGLNIPHERNVEAGGFVTVSCGVSTALPRLGGSNGTLQGLLQAADNALYNAKRQGRNRVVTSVLLTTPAPLAQAS